MNTITRNANQHIADPRQEAFKAAYFDPDSKTFGNAYQSAVQSGYTEATAKDILHNRPKWLSDFGGSLQIMEPTELLGRLTAIANGGGNATVTTRDKLKAIELMMKYHGMLKERVDMSLSPLNIGMVLD